MLLVDDTLEPRTLVTNVERLWSLAADKIISIQATSPPHAGAPVFTRAGKYTARGWTEWTQGFQFGAALLQFDATDDGRFLEIGRSNTIKSMATHVSHTGVHDHGFNNVSTYGNLRRLMREGRLPHSACELDFYELALKTSGAVQAARWTEIAPQQGYIYSFNGPHSLFSDTIRSLRSLTVAHRLGHTLMSENDLRVSLLERAILHASATATYNVYYGENRDAYDIRGRVAHESIFNTNDGNYRCPSTQQGYSPFTTWTRGLAWVMLGFAEQLEFLSDCVSDDELDALGGRENIADMMLRAARATSEFFIENTPTDGVPYWDTGAPGLQHLPDYLDRPSDPFNNQEPVDSSAAAIAAQALLRLGNVLKKRGNQAEGKRYFQAGLSVLRTLLAEPYLAVDPRHQGLLLHTIYHRPKGWDHVPEGAAIPRGEACMWGDYHLLEVALLVQRIAGGGPYLTFYGP
jgi:hypothetical protein